MVYHIIIELFLQNFIIYIIVTNGSHHSSDEKKVTMPGFYINFPAENKVELEALVIISDKCINHKFTMLERRISMLVGRHPLRHHAHARQGRHPPPEHHVENIGI